MVSKEIFRAGDIEISPKALDGHKKHGDMYSTPEEGCPMYVMPQDQQLIPMK